jgi:SnoaL-like domain
VDSLRATLGGLEATQHLQGNHLVDSADAHATCTACFQATHILANPYGSPRRTLGGNYRFELIRTADGWRISAMTMTAVWADGNQQIMTIAARPDH